jgi:hypothetical protein
MRFHARDVGKAVCGSAAQCSSGIVTDLTEGDRAGTVAKGLLDAAGGGRRRRKDLFGSAKMLQPLGSKIHILILIHRYLRVADRELQRLAMLLSSVCSHFKIALG